MSDLDALRSLLTDLKTATTLIKVRAAATNAAKLLDVAPVPTPVPTPPPVPTPTPAPTGGFKVDTAGLIRDSAGAVWVGHGANVGQPCGFDWNGLQDWGVSSWDGFAKGHSSDAQAWDWKAIRDNVVIGGPGAWGCQVNPMTEAQAVIDEYTPKGFVVEVASHDMRMGTATEQDVLAWFRQLVAANKGNPLVWYNPHNEPPVSGQAYIDLCYRAIDAIRQAGATSPIVLDMVQSSNEAEWDYGPYAPETAPLFRARDPLGNVVLSMHNYGGITDAARLSAHIDAVRRHGVAFEIGEFGYALEARFTTAGPATAEQWQRNKDGTTATLAVARSKGVPVKVWHPTHGDGYSLKVNSKAFWDGGNGNGLSELGRSMWALTH